MYKFLFVTYVLSLVLVCENDAARILAYYPAPSISHQVVFRPLTLELVRRGHDVVVITPDPVYPNKDGPANLKEIDVHDLSYTIWRKMTEELQNSFERDQFKVLLKLFMDLVELQVNSSEVQSLINDESITFDLVIVEAIVEIDLGIAHVYKAPTIQFSSLGASSSSLRIYGAPVNPIVYPSPFNEKLYNMTIWDKISELYADYKFEQIIPGIVEDYDCMLKRTFGSDIPPFYELRGNVDLTLLNVHHVWDFNRPVPPNVIYLGGLQNEKIRKELPEDLKRFLDSSKNGVIYVSFGSNVDPTMFPPEIIQTLVNVFSKQPYDVLWKWNKDELPGRTENIKISKWLPQSDLLRHPKIKLFITQGGLQSTDEAITAGVPLIGVPVFGDQKYNVEQYLHFKIGERVELDSITEEKLADTINKMVRDDSYRKNVEKLREIMNDSPQTPLEKAVWWTEYVIRHKGAKHLRSPAANMSIAEYYEFKLVAYVVFGLLTVISLIIYVAYIAYSFLLGSNKKNKHD